MQHWLTVHYPQEIGREEEPGQSGVWMRKEYVHCFEDLDEGNGVLIYETFSGPKRFRESSDGYRERSEYHQGRGAVISVGSVVELASDPPLVRKTDDNGVEIDWVKLAELKVMPLPHPVARTDVNMALGLQPKAVMRGFRGLRRITETEYRAIVEAGSR
jgi:hypothetical protein